MKHLTYNGILEIYGFDTNIGININDSNAPWSELILSKEKTIETRSTNSLKPYINKKVGIIRTGKGQALLVGFMRLGEPKIYNTLKEFRMEEGLHRVNAGNVFDWVTPKFGYPIYDVQRIDTPMPITSWGIVARKLEKNMYKFKEFVNEAIDTSMGDLLKSVDSEKATLSDIEVDISEYAGKDIEFLYDDAKFNTKLYNVGLKKSEMQSSLDLETFLIGDIKFFFLFNRETPKLGNPKYIMLQYKQQERWSDIRIYRIHDSIRNFFEKLTVKTIELNDAGVTYLYQTTNRNNWKLMNIEKQNYIYKETLENDELRNILNKGVKVKIIE